MDKLPPIIKLLEHGKLDSDTFSSLLELGVEFKETEYMQPPSYLGIKPDGKASYYIGADWLHSEKSIAITVLPKMPNVDFIEMYMAALKFDLATDYFSQIYYIDFSQKEIETDVLNDQLTPLLILHFLNITKRIVKRGLKHDYVNKEENLQSKIKGRIKVAKNNRINSIPRRHDRVFCKFDEYIVNTPENRLLKKALLFSKKYIQYLQSHKSFPIINRQINEVLSYFVNVSSEIEIHQVRKITHHKIYKEYSDGLNLAKMILRHFSYSLQNISNVKNKITPFWIDMARLYEVYVYSLLHDKFGDDIQFQVEGAYGTAVDFIKESEKLIIDTKYKPQYTCTNIGIVHDIRQISGYARDIKILERLNISESFVPSCLIIYPEKMDEKDKLINNFEDDTLLESAVEIKQFKKFYKLSVALPKL